MISKVNQKVAIFGLGYVGLPLACLCVENGYEVNGVDIDQRVVDLLKQNICPINDSSLIEKLSNLKGNLFATNDGLTAVKNSDIVLVCVPTPVDSNHHPNLTFLENVMETISEGLSKEQLIIIESTIYPGTIDNIVLPILENCGLMAGIDFYLAHCPERIDPGNKRWEIVNIPRVVGGVNDASAIKAAEFYRTILDAEVYELDSIKAVEAVKITENAFRDINIAFINELAKSFDKLGINIMEVIKGASTKPFGYMPFYPGIGVGGHCIPVDPYYLIARGKEVGFDYKFLSLAREINNSMPKYTVELVMDALNDIGKSIKGTKIAVLGLAYKKDVDDLRESPSIEFINELKKKGAILSIFDPYLPKMSTSDSLEHAIDGCECVVIATDHTEFKALDGDVLNEKCVKILIDGRNMLDQDEISKSGIIYKGIGK